MAGLMLAVADGQGGGFAVGLVILLVELAAQLWIWRRGREDPPYPFVGAQTSTLHAPQCAWSRSTVRTQLRAEADRSSARRSRAVWITRSFLYMAGESSRSF
jgi:hypothetical protein